MCLSPLPAPRAQARCRQANCHGLSLGDHDRRCCSAGRRCRSDAGARGDNQRKREAGAEAHYCVGENIVAQGAQARKGDELLATGTAITAAQVALAAACGHAALEVFTRPRVAILTTGDEIVPVKSVPAPGQIRNSNGPMLAAMVVAAGGEPWILPTASDNARALDTALAQAAEADLLLITGGVSAGKFDLVEPALVRAGARFQFTGVRIQQASRWYSERCPDIRTQRVTF